MTYETDSEKQQDENRRDYNHEISGQDVGRIKRFLSEEAREYVESQKSVKSRDKLSYLDIMLLTDPAFLELYTDVTEQIEKIDDAITKSLSSLEQRRIALEERMNDIQNNAYRLEDGTRVYRDKNGDVYTEDDEVLSNNEVSDIIWTSSHSTREELHQTRSAQEQVNSSAATIETYRDDKFQNIKDRMNDHKNLDTDELRDIIREMNEGFPSELSIHIEKPDNSAEQSSFMKQFSTKMAGATNTETTENDVAPSPETPAHESGGSSFLSNFSNSL